MKNPTDDTSRDSESSLCLVVDGGGTKTNCQMLRQQGAEFKVLGVGSTTGCNPAELGIEAAGRAILAAIRQATAEAGISDLSAIDRAALAVAGTLDDTIRSQLETQLAALFPAKACRVFPDVLPYALHGPDVEQSVAVVAGTGSVAIARQSLNTYSLVGGWGYLLGDEGSGYAIGREALRLALMQLETGVPISPLTDRVLGMVQAKCAADIKRYVYGGEPPRRSIAAVARTVIELQAAGSPECDHLLDRAATSLASLARRAASMVDTPWETISISGTGGILTAGEVVWGKFEKALQVLGHHGPVEQLDCSMTACRQLLDRQVFAAPFSIQS
ncbi:N-acetylglucosamine kinase [Aeoliella mucimassa]|uniref:N-acetylglucosamine kinase n=1 Tax=Aeoliella mucimassa TaxID=2527972 RepID=UPI0018D30C68|nr:BadF/BadG/BcrA/BcrD ATPase family protein [Aeoliella mucimassa]